MFPVTSANNNFPNVQIMMVESQFWWLNYSNHNLVWVFIFVKYPVAFPNLVWFHPHKYPHIFDEFPVPSAKKTPRTSEKIMPLVFASGKRSRAAQRSFHFCCRPAVWNLSKTGAIPKNNSLSEISFLWTSYRGRRIDHFVAILKRIFWLVVSNIFYFPFHIWDVILPIDELIFFKMVKTTNQFSWEKHD